jgi:hypothetical protein
MRFQKKEPTLAEKINLTKNISLQEAAEMLARCNPEVGDVEHFKKLMMEAVEKGELTLADESLN